METTRWVYIQIFKFIYRRTIPLLDQRIKGAKGRDRAEKRIKKAREKAQER